MKLDPWSSTQYQDYARLRDEFGIDTFDPQRLPHPQKLFRRGVVFGQRGFEYIERAIRNGDPFAVMSGLMPSGRMHLGNKMVLDQVLYFQSLGAHVFVAVADLESFGARGVSLDQGRRTALEEYIVNYIALGLDPNRCQIYFQSQRRAVKDLAFLLARRINLSTMRAIYGFEGSTNMAHVNAPLVQVGDILHPQLETYLGPLPVLVPVGVDQDPHIRLTRECAAAHRLFNATRTKDGRIGVFVKIDEQVKTLLDNARAALKRLGYADIEQNTRYKALYLPGATEGDLPAIDAALVPVERDHDGYGFYPPAATYHRFMTGLTGSKMSSSKPETCIFLTDEPELAKKKVMRAKTGGGQTLEEHKKFGGDPDSCAVYELCLYHLLDDDDELQTIYDDCRAGKQLCGMCKKYAGTLIAEFLRSLAKKRDAAQDQLDAFVHDD